MNYTTAKEIAVTWRISGRRVLQYCNAGRINGAIKWRILGLFLNRYSPMDQRFKENKYKETGREECTGDEQI